MRSESNLLNVVSSGGLRYRWAGGINPAPADFAVNTATVTFDGVVAGSEIRIYRFDGVALAGVETCDADHLLTWETYAIGSAYNDVRVVIANTAYRLLEFQYTAVSGTTSIPIQMEADRWYSNP